jgi:hypothetical protein
MTDNTTWQVIVKFGEPRLIIEGQYHQEFSIIPGSNAKWMAKMLRRAMRRIAPDAEKKRQKKPLQSP